MEKKLSADTIRHIDETIQRLSTEWEELKWGWNHLDTPGALDKAFYKFVDVWLATDGLIDQETHAHSLSYWNDPDLETIRQTINSLQIRLSKIDDPERKRRGVERLQQTLQAMEF